VLARIPLETARCSTPTGSSDRRKEGLCTNSTTACGARARSAARRTTRVGCSEQVSAPIRAHRFRPADAPSRPMQLRSVAHRVRDHRRGRSKNGAALNASSTRCARRLPPAIDDFARASRPSTMSSAPDSMFLKAKRPSSSAGSTQTSRTAHSCAASSRSRAILAYRTGREYVEDDEAREVSTVELFRAGYPHPASDAVDRRALDVHSRNIPYRRIAGESPRRCYNEASAAPITGMRRLAHRRAHMRRRS